MFRLTVDKPNPIFVLVENRPEFTGGHGSETLATVGLARGPPMIPTFASRTSHMLYSSKVYQIDYDLRKPGRNYDSLITAIKAIGAWAHPLKSTWIVATTMTAIQLRDYLWKHMDATDGLLVTRLQSEAAWEGINPDVGKWLTEKVSRAA
jgi:hypothetical protein